MREHADILTHIKNSGLLFAKPFFILLCLLPSIANAQAVTRQTIVTKISAGTGFFVNSNGYLITNAHVLHDCKSVNILAPRGEREAQLIASDPEHDLALLRAIDMGGASVASLRANISNLRVGDNVNVYGFPGQQGAQGQHTYKKTTVVNLQGPTGEPLWIQLSSVAQKGNSGGPVLDSTGNVIAVISGIAQTYKIDANGAMISSAVSQSDIAITLLTLEDFLQKNGISYNQSNSSLLISGDSAIERQAANFTVPVRCIQSVTKLD